MKKIITISVLFSFLLLILIENAKSNTFLMRVDPTKITTSTTNVPITEDPFATSITVIGTAGAAMPGSEVLASTNLSEATFSTIASEDGSFEITVTGSCKNSATTVFISEKVNEIISEPITKTSLCTCCTQDTIDSIFDEISGEDDVPTIQECLSYIASNGGLAVIVSGGGGKLEGTIKAIKTALGLS